MNTTLHHFKQLRNHLYQITEKLSEKQILYIPKGFNNNIFWNVAHCIVTQQLLIYYLSGNTTKIENRWIENFKKGTKPNHDFFEFNKKELLELLTFTTNEFENDLPKLKESEYNAYSTSFGVNIETISQAIEFNNLHEALHLGYIMAMKKLI